MSNKIKKKPKQSNPSMLPLYFLASGIVLVLVAVVILSQPSKTTPVDAGMIERVSPVEAWEAWESGQAVLLDVRAESDFAANHAAGSVNIPLSELENRLEELPREKWIITYCT